LSDDGSIHSFVYIAKAHIGLFESVNVLGE
jgi:hypothetical protein